MGQEQHDKGLNETIREHARNQDSAFAIVRAVDDYATVMRSFRAQQVEVITRLQKKIASLEDAAAERERLLAGYIMERDRLQKTIAMHWDGKTE